MQRRTQTKRAVTAIAAVSTRKTTRMRMRTSHPQYSNSGVIRDEWFLDALLAPAAAGEVAVRDTTA